MNRSNAKINVINVLCKCCRGGTGGSVGPCISIGSDNPGVSDGVLVAVEEQVSKKKTKRLGISNYLVSE